MQTNRLKWRVVDWVVASVLAVATGGIFLIWNQVGGQWWQVMDAVTPGWGGIALGPWLLGGVLGGLIIRKPGAALYVETLAAIVSALMGSQWGIGTVYSGLAQGLGAELIFIALMYKRFNLPVALLSGVGAAVGAWILEGFQGNFAKGAAFLLNYAIAGLISGAILAGLLGWAITRALAASGALDRFAVGREAAPTVNTGPAA
ncbi:ECF transporter S component [Stomatohabitans albus]|uniref:ECF transporter S component n=1 Tax=Stomatohabitans albus TaxID=3110766 RepID=UPI00300D31B9